MNKKTGVQTGRGGDTEAVTLRLSVGLKVLYAKIAARANIMDLKKGGRGGVTAQDVMRHQLHKLEKRFFRRSREKNRLNGRDTMRGGND